MKTQLFLVIAILLVIVHYQNFAQGVAINTDNSAPDPSAMLDVNSTNRGMLIPRMTTAQRTAVAAPAAGLLVFDNTTQSFWFFSAGSWIELTDQGSLQWTPNGSNISYSAGNVGIGDATPAATLTVGNGDKFQVSGAQGDVTFTDDEASIQFPSTTNPNSPMIYMFNSGTSNADRMMIGHSPSFPKWGIEYDDTLDVVYFRNNFSRTVGFHLNGYGSAGIGLSSENPMATFHVKGQTQNRTAVFGTPVGGDYYNTNVGIGNDQGNASLYIGKDLGDFAEFRWNFNENPAQGFLSIQTVGSPILSLQESGGRVGVGTTVPQSKFEVYTNPSNYTQLGVSNSVGSFFYQNQSAALGTGQTPLLAGRYRAASAPGSSYGSGLTNSAISAFSDWGDPYTFAITGHGWNDFGRSGAVFGAWVGGSYWGALAYRTSALQDYGGYFTSSTNGAGKSLLIKTGIGIGAWGELFGADIHGEVYGIYTEGNDYALYAAGTTFQSGPQVHLQPNGTEQQTVLYANVSTDMTVQTSGYAELSSGKATINFDDSFRNSVSSGFPVVVTVTPVGVSQGLYLTETSSRGFSVAESGDAGSNARFAFIAIGKRAGFEQPVIPAEVTRADYSDKVKRGLHNDADTKSKGEGLYYENGKLMVGKHPSVMVDRTEIAPQSGFFVIR